MKNLKERYLRWLAVARLRRRYEYLVQVDKVLEEYLTEKILQGGSSEFVQKGRADLVKKQEELKTNSEFLAFLRKTK